MNKKLESPVFFNQLNASTPLKNSINFRSLEGIKNRDGGLIKEGKLFRSGDFSQLSSAECKALTGHIDVIVDYRDPYEIEKKPDRLWAKAHYIEAPANPLSAQVTAACTDESRAAQQALSDYLRQQGAMHFMLTLYKYLPFNNAGYQQLIAQLLEPLGPSLVQHCAVGKDRTGVGVALTLAILGVDEETIIEEYLLTEQGLAPFRQKLLDDLAEQLSADALEERKIIYSAKEIFITTALSEIKQKYGTLDRWLEIDYGVTAQKRAQIQDHYLK